MTVPRGTVRASVRLYLVTRVMIDPGGLAHELSVLLRLADIAAVLATVEPGPERAMIEAVKQIAPAVQDAGVALLVAERADVVARAGADGAHLTGVAALGAAILSLKPGRIAGVGGLRTRHDAMLAGEAGADYVMFGEPSADGRRPPLEAVVDRVTWWAELFEVPCVGYAASLDEIAPLCAARADFIALGTAVFSDARGAAGALLDASERLRHAEAMA